MHLRYDYMTASLDCSENRHACAVMQELGITYQHSTPQSLGDQFWFWNCKGIPDELPKYVTELKIDPMKAIGHGLSNQLADAIIAGAAEVLDKVKPDDVPDWDEKEGD